MIKTSQLKLLENSPKTPKRKLELDDIVYNFVDLETDLTNSPLQKKIRLVKKKDLIPQAYSEQKKDESSESLCIESKAVENKEKIQLDKYKLREFIQSITNLELSNDVLTDIVIKGDESNFVVLGRPNVKGSSTKQMRHVTPYSFVEKLIKFLIENSLSNKYLLNELTNYLSMFLKEQKGFCLSQNDLETTPYQQIKDNLEKEGKKCRVMNKDEDRLLLYSPTKSKNIFNTPEKKKKAESEYSNQNIKFIKLAMNKLIDAIEGNGNETIIAAEAITRLMFIVFNQREGAAFPEEGNTRDYEIRLYKNKEKAAVGGKGYEVVTARELKDIHEEAQKNKEIEPISERIRIVDCSSHKVKIVPDALQNIGLLIDQLLCEQNIDKHIDQHNNKYNLKLKLANYSGNFSKYNEAFTKDNYKSLLPFHISKLLYSVFDFTALEKTVFVGDRKSLIKVYNTASGEVLTQYDFDDGQEFREYEKGGVLKGYNKEVVFRDEKTDLGLLARKLVEHFVISLIPIKKFLVNFFLEEKESLLSKSLKQLVDLTSLDYQMEESDLKEFCKSTSDYYSEITNENYLSSNNNSQLSLVGFSNAYEEFFDN